MNFNQLKLNFKTIKVSYIINGRKTSCIIKWYNPLKGGYRRTRAGTVCHPDDTFDEQTGKHIAFKRCLLNIIKNYYKDLDDFHLDLIRFKHNLEDKIKIFNNI